MDTTFGRKFSVNDSPMTAGAELIILPMTDVDIPSSSRKNRSFGRSVESTPYCNSDGCFITATFKSSIGMPTGAIEDLSLRKTKSHIKDAGSQKLINSCLYLRL
jgi:hypothetical protein